MKIVYEEGDHIKLRRVDELPDPDDWGLEQEELDKLLEAQDDGHTFEVLFEATDDYYTIKNLTTGVTYEAVCVYHFVPAAKDVLTLLDI
jgi:hypothetical protein